MSLHHIWILGLVLAGLIGAHLGRPYFLWFFQALDQFSRALCEALTASTSSLSEKIHARYAILGPCCLLIGTVLAGVDVRVITNCFVVIMGFGPHLAACLALSLVLATFVSALLAHIALECGGWARAGLLLLSLTCLGVNMRWQYRLYYERNEIIKEHARRARHPDRKSPAAVSRIGGHQITSPRSARATYTPRYVGPSSQEMAAIPLTLAGVQGISFAGGVHMLCSLLPANRQTFRDTLIKLFQWFWEILWTLFSALAAVGGALVKVLQAVTNALLRGLRRIWAGLERVGRVVLALLERWSADPLDKETREIDHRLEMARKQAEVDVIQSQNDRAKESRAAAAGVRSDLRGMEADVRAFQKDAGKIIAALIERTCEIIRDPSGTSKRTEIDKTIKEGIEAVKLYQQELINAQKEFHPSLKELEKHLSAQETESKEETPHDS